MIVNLTYFFLNGKFAGKGSYNSNLKNLFEIHDEVINLLEQSKLPGLKENHSLNYIISIDVSDPHIHPHLIIKKPLNQLPQIHDTIIDALCGLTDIFQESIDNNRKKIFELKNKLNNILKDVT